MNPFSLFTYVLTCSLTLIRAILVAASCYNCSLSFLFCILICDIQEFANEAQVWDDSRGAPEARGGGVQHGAPVCAHPVSEEQHTGPHQLSQQQEAAGKSQGLRQVTGTLTPTYYCSWLWDEYLIVFNSFFFLLTQKGIVVFVSVIP